MNKPDFLIIGAGIIGISVALEIKRRYQDSSVLLIDKEDSIGKHASGRNSGVLHAGFYYSENSYKAQFCREGNHEWTEYCLDKGLPIKQCGKLVVTKNELELDLLERLLNQARLNQVNVEKLDVYQTNEIEPRVKTFQHSLFAPGTSTIDPMATTKRLLQDAIDLGVIFQSSCAFKSVKGRKIVTNKGLIEPGYTINAAGLYADQIARQYGFSENLRILPFKGLYLISSEPPEAFQTNIYPVPDPSMPFLGVHITLSVDGKIKYGPTAMPALWREQYHGFDGISLKEFAEIAKITTCLMMDTSTGVRQQAFREIPKYFKKKMIEDASSLARNISTAAPTAWSRPGIRAQLVNTLEKKLVMDFHHEGDDTSFHILNAVSPAFTCALPFSRYLVSEMSSLIK